MFFAGSRWSRRVLGGFFISKKKPGTVFSKPPGSFTQHLEVFIMLEISLSKNEEIMKTEKTILGEIILDSEHFLTRAQDLRLSPCDFSPAWRPVYQALLDLRQIGCPLDPVSVWGRLFEKEELGATPVKIKEDLEGLPLIAAAGPVERDQKFAELAGLLKNVALAELTDSVFCVIDGIRADASLEPEEQINAILEKVACAKEACERKMGSLPKGARDLLEIEDYDIQDFVYGQKETFEMIIPGFLKGTVGVLLGPGAVGKSFFALEFAMAAAGGGQHGTNILGLKILAKPGKILYLSAEDPKPIIKNRVLDIVGHFGEEGKRLIVSNLKIKGVSDAMPDLHQKDEEKEKNRINLDALKIIKMAEGCQLIILDTFIRFHSADENSNNDIAGVVKTLEFVAGMTGASVLILHHVNKSAVRNAEGKDSETADSRGATSLTDNCRYVMNLASIRKKEAENFGIPASDRKFYVKLTVTKQNFEEIPNVKWLKRTEGGVLVPVNLKPMPKGQKKTGEENIHETYRQKF